MTKDLAKHIYSELDSGWTIDRSRGSFSSPVAEGQDYQRIIFDESFRDGTISAEITIRRSEQAKGEPQVNPGVEPRSAALIFRFQDSKNYYFAGVGGNGHKFFLSRMVERQGQLITATGFSASVEIDVPYKIEVRCSGNRISLAHNNVVHLQTFDNTFHSGQWGLQSWRTRVDFAKLSSDTSKPNCFVIMPFASEFDEVYLVIKETVEKYRFECIRADQRYLVGPIMDDVNDQIEKADLIVADLTGKNPNVFYMKSAMRRRSGSRSSRSPSPRMIFRSMSAI